MRVLLVHQAFASAAEPGGTRHAELGQFLAGFGDEMVVIASQVSYATGRPTTKTRRALIRDDRAGKVRVLRVWVPAVIHRSYVWRTVAFVAFATNSILASFRAGPVDIVMGTTPPIFQAVSAWLIARVRRRPFLLEIRDLWPEFAIGMGILRNPVLIALSRWLERFLYRRADRLLVNSPAYVEYLTSRGVPADKIDLVPNGVDTRMFDPYARGEAFRQAYGGGSEVLAVYAGAIGAANDLDTVIDAAERFRGNLRVRFLFVGDGKEHGRLETEVKRRGLDNVTFTGPVPKAQMPDVLAAADICIATLMNIPMFATTYPNKVFDYMAAGRPIVLAIDGVIRHVVDAANCGIFVTPGDSAALADAITVLAADSVRRRSLGANARAYVTEHFDRAQQSRLFRCTLKTLSTWESEAGQ